MRTDFRDTSPHSLHQVRSIAPQFVQQGIEQKPKNTSGEDIWVNEGEKLREGESFQEIAEENIEENEK